jgi:hypothetical protein
MMNRFHFCLNFAFKFNLRRYIMAAPLGDRVFFAGEATHLGVNPCMQGAMETGIRAASQVLACVNGHGRAVQVDPVNPR